MNTTEKVKINFTGDVLLGYLPYQIGTGYVNHINQKDYNKLSDDVFSSLEGDLNVINLECPLINDYNKSEKEAFAGNYNSAEFLTKINANIANIANNHILEHGEIGINQTESILTKKNIDVVGIKPRNRLLKTVNGVSIEFISLNNTTSKSTKLCVSVSDVSDNSLEINDSADFNIVLIHWGDEYMNIPSEKQKKLAYSFIDKGVDIVIGHHPHVLQPIEEYKSGLICYSLGNFLFDDLFDKNVTESIILEIELEKNSNIIKYRYTPILLDRELGFTIGNENHSIDRKLKNRDHHVKDYTRKAYNANLRARFKVKLFLFKLVFFSKNRKKIINNILSYVKRKII